MMDLEDMDFEILQPARPNAMDDVNKFLEEQENDNKRRKTTGDMNLFHTYLESQQEFRRAEFIPPSELNNYMASFFLAVKKKDGEEYEPLTVRSFFSSIDRYLRRMKYPVHILSDIQFATSREVLRSKQKQLKSLGKGNKPWAADDITDEEIDKMYDANVLGPHNASLLHTLWLMNSIHFGIRTGLEARNLKWGDIQLKENEEESYLIYNKERQTKTRTGMNPRNVRATKPRAYSLPDQPDRDPVELYHLYRSKRPDGYLDPDTPFYLSIHYIKGEEPGPYDSWYKKCPMGKNRIYDIMNRLKVGAQMEGTDTRLTNYSARKHLCQKLSDKGVPPNQIIQISGHKNVNSLNNYSRLNPNQCRNISHLLSNKDETQSAIALPPSMTSAVTTKSSSSTHSSASFSIPNSIPGLFVGNEIHGNINVNFHQAPPQQTTSSVMTESQCQFVLPAELSEGFQCTLPALQPLPSTDTMLSGPQPAQTTT